MKGNGKFILFATDLTMAYIRRKCKVKKKTKRICKGVYIKNDFTLVYGKEKARGILILKPERYIYALQQTQLWVLKFE